MECIKVCPKAKELSEILNEVRCSHCDLKFANTSRLEMHLLKIHKKVKLEKKEGVFHYHCPDNSCKYALIEPYDKSRYFTKLKYLKQHYQKVHLEKTIQCEKCQKLFVTDLQKLSHIERECQVFFSCLSCSKEYKTKSALLTHCKRSNHCAPVYRYFKKSENKERKILPKESVEDIAVAALSELSWKVVVRKGVDVGVQTDHRSCSRKRVKKDTKTQTQRSNASISTQTEDSILEQNLLSQILPQNYFTSATQTTSDEMMLDLFPDIDQHVNNQTQTELINEDLILDEDSPILSDTHTQTMMDDYSHNYTQTCQDFFLPDFVEFSDIETQTAWASLTMDDICHVSAQTQTLL